MHYAARPVGITVLGMGRSVTSGFATAGARIYSRRQSSNSPKAATNGPKACKDGASPRLSEAKASDWRNVRYGLAHGFTLFSIVEDRDGPRCC